MIETYNVTSSIALTINSSNNGKIIPILTDVQLPTNPVSVNLFIKNLKAYAKISSLPPIKLPNLEITDSQTEQIYKVLDTEWNSPRKQLNLFWSVDSVNWVPVGSLSLLNPSGYPYRTYNLMDFYNDNGIALEMGMNGNIGIQVQDVGYGNLQGNDTVTVFGNYIIECVEDDTVNSTQNLNVQVNNVSTQLLLQTNPKYIILENTGDSPIWLGFNQQALIGQGICLLPGGSAYEIPFKYNGNISAISAGSTLSGVIGYFMPLYNVSGSANFSSSTATATTVTASTTSEVLLPANSARKGFTIYNNSTNILYVDFEATASTTNFIVPIKPSGYFESPFNYTGVVSGLWDGTNGNAEIREFS